MTIPTNWPNPERPGVPSNPTISGWHWLKRIFALDFEVHYWVASENYDGSWTQEWECKTGNFSPELMEAYEYYSPVLTPTQITEMLAGERERCARAAENHRSKANPRVVGEWDIVQSTTANSIAHAIRNLGAAP